MVTRPMSASNGSASTPAPASAAETTATYERLPCPEQEATQVDLGPWPEGCGLLDPRTAFVVVIHGPMRGARFPLDGTCSVGRSPENSIRLDHPAVSRRHAVFRPHGRGFAVADVFSLNGTYVNGVRTPGMCLGSGDRVQIGPFVLIYLPGEPDPTPATVGSIS